MFPGKITGSIEGYSANFKEHALKLVECKEYHELSPVIIFSMSENGNILSLEGRALSQVNINKDSHIGRNIFSITPLENEFLSL